MSKTARLWKRGLCERLKSLRIANGLSQRALAKKIKVDQSLITHIEKGQALSLQTFFDLCIALQVHPSEILAPQFEIKMPDVKL